METTKVLSHGLWLVSWRFQEKPCLLFWNEKNRFSETFFKNVLGFPRSETPRFFYQPWFTNPLTQVYPPRRIPDLGQGRPRHPNFEKCAKRKFGSLLFFPGFQGFQASIELNSRGLFSIENCLQIGQIEFLCVGCRYAPPFDFRLTESPVKVPSLRVA